MGCQIIEDTRQQVARGDKHAVKHVWFAAHGVQITRTKLDFGDYARSGSNIAVDTKRSVDEIAQNLSRDHERFKRECIRAREAGWRLVILIEDGRFANPGELAGWTNAHCIKCPIRRRVSCNPRTPGKCPRHKTLKPIQGDRLSKAMATMSARYGVRFEFCAPADAGRIICELLGAAYDKDTESDSDDVQGHRVPLEAGS